MSKEIEFQTTVRKDKRITIPSSLYQIKTGDIVIVKIEKIGRDNTV